jgi:hypothetical protein
MLCSVAIALAAVPVFAQQPYGAGVRRPPQNTAPIYDPGIQQAQYTRQAATFGTPFPTRPTPGPVPTVFDQQQQQPMQPMPAEPAQFPVTGPQAKPVLRQAAPQRTAATVPGAAGKIMYFHKPAGATSVDGSPDSSTLAMASSDAPVSSGVPDVSAPPVGVPAPVAVPPATVIEKPVPAPAAEPYVPPPAFAPVPETPREAAFPIPPRVAPPMTAPPAVKEPGPEVTRLPEKNIIFQVWDDRTLEEMIYANIASQLGKTPQELKKTSPFPTLKPVVPPGTPYVAKTAALPPRVALYEPGFVIHNKLHFEEKNSERYGWDLGFATPIVETMAFYKNTLLWPQSIASMAVTGKMDTNAGKCLPGSATPYILYPQGLTITGGVVEGLVVTGAAVIIVP